MVVVGAGLIELQDKLKKVTRFEVIDENGRSYTKFNVEEVEFVFQDDGRTLKMFLKTDASK